MKYTSLQLDALKEVINIGGGGHAATSISKLVARKIEMDVPAVKILSYHELYKISWLIMLRFMRLSVGLLANMVELFCSWWQMMLSLS